MIDIIVIKIYFLAHLLKSHQLHQSQTVQSPVQTILQPNQPEVVQAENQPVKVMDGIGPSHQPPPKRLLQNFVPPTPNPPTPPMPRAKKEPLTVKFESVGAGSQQEKVRC